MMLQSPIGRTLNRAVSTAALLLAVAASAVAQSTLPSLYADSTFWRMTIELSEPDGFFRSDNLVSNESSFQWVVPTLQQMARPDGVYLGVAPEQNFTFIAALKPNGKLVLVEYRAESDSVPIKQTHKMTEAQVIKELTVHPLTWEKTIETLPW